MELPLKLECSAAMAESNTSSRTGSSNATNANNQQANYATGYVLPAIGATVARAKPLERLAVTLPMVWASYGKGRAWSLPATLPWRVAHRDSVG